MPDIRYDGEKEAVFEVSADPIERVDGGDLNTWYSIDGKSLGKVSQKLLLKYGVSDSLYRSFSDSGKRVTIFW